ncbi:MAG: hypothetical protein JWO48_503 [Bryobacterales bacterium]|jgi:hypothetical protein|nr:hypothetical protein [Bryobacterales bacterium]
MPNFHEPIIVDRATPIYRALLLECERKRQQLGWAMWQVDEISGLQEGHYAKCLHVDRLSGRQANWPTLHLIVSALWSEGFDLVIKDKPGGTLTAEGVRMKIRHAAADHDRISRRELMSTLGKKGGEARGKKYKEMTKEERLQIARKARKTRRKNRALRSQSRGLLATNEARP